MPGFGLFVYLPTLPDQGALPWWLGALRFSSWQWLGSIPMSKMLIAVAQFNIHTLLLQTDRFNTLPVFLSLISLGFSCRLCLYGVWTGKSKRHSWTAFLPRTRPFFVVESNTPLFRFCLYNSNWLPYVHQPQVRYRKYTSICLAARTPQRKRYRCFSCSGYRSGGLDLKPRTQLPRAQDGHRITGAKRHYVGSASRSSSPPLAGHDSSGSCEAVPCLAPF